MIKAVLVANVLIEREGKILLIKAKTGSTKGLWNTPGGHLEENETFTEAAKREVKEETGLDVELGKVLCIGHRYMEKQKIITTVFKAKSIKGTLILQEDEIEQAKWFLLEEIKNIEKEKICHIVPNAIKAFEHNEQIIYKTNRVTT